MVRNCLFFLICLPLSLFGACNLTFTLAENDSGSVFFRDDDVHYNSESNTRNQFMNFTVSNTDSSHSGNCPYFITASAGSSADYDQRRLVLVGGTETLNYNIQKDNNGTRIIKEVPLTGITNFNVLTGRVVDGGSQTKNLRFRIPDSQRVTSGHYRDTITYKLYDQNFNRIDPEPPSTFTPVQTLTVVMDAFATPRIAVSTGGSIDFGYPETGESQGFTIQIYSNVRYNINMLSAQGGELAHTTVSTVDGIPYTVTDQESDVVTLTTAHQTMLSNLTIARNGRTHAFTVTLGALPSNLFAGDYQDTITIQIQDN